MFLQNVDIKNKTENALQFDQKQSDYIPLGIYEMYEQLGLAKVIDLLYSASSRPTWMYMNYFTGY